MLELKFFPEPVSIIDETQSPVFPMRNNSRNLKGENKQDTIDVNLDSLDINRNIESPDIKDFE